MRKFAILAALGVMTAFCMGLILITLHYSVSKAERAECAKWIEQSVEHKENWFWADWQVAQCRSYGYTVDK